jgi:cytochrome c peroxidase
MIAEIILALVIPLGLDLYLPVPDDNPLTAERIELGRRLFFDTRLSRDRSLSCGSCHRPERAFADDAEVSAGTDGRLGRRHSPALINRGYGIYYFWDGRVKTLEEQVLQPIEDPNELGSNVHEAARRVGVTVQEMRKALASFVRSILSGNSRFDRFMDGERSALSEDEQAGLLVFRGKGNCVSCHVGPNFTDERLHNTGVAWRGDTFADPGAGQGRFKTATLREIARTAPYMHDGSIETIEHVIEFYDRGGNANASLDTQIQPLRLSAIEKAQLAAFLRSLSGEVRFGAQ